MAWKLKYRCKTCGYEAEMYDGRGLFRQQITAMSCPDCKTIQNIVVGGIIADVAPSYRSEVGRLCLQCGSDNIRIWDKHTCPKCQGEMEDTGEREFGLNYQGIIILHRSIAHDLLLNKLKVYIKSLAI